jgi:PAS domain S-box-containing protein
MSELINNTNQYPEALCRFAERLINGENGNLLIEEYKQDLNSVNAAEAMQVFDYLLVNGYPFSKVKQNVGKIINVFYKSLASKIWNKPPEGHFLHYMMLENREVEKRMNSMRPLIKELLIEKSGNERFVYTKLLSLISELQEYELHYIKKENMLFSWLEKTFPEYRCIKLMWSFDDDFRKSVKLIESILKDEEPDKKVLNKEFGKLFFVVFPLIFREEQIIFPVALRSIPDKVWEEMMIESFATGWCFGVKPEYKANTGTLFSSVTGLVNLETGLLNAEQIILMLENLPVDITFVDENNEVRYFSGAKHRIFHRSKAIIGRKVQNCHPPESVHIVDRIIDAFRSGEQDKADFRIHMKGRIIHINYYALRNEKGEYKGTIEVSQDVTEIKALDGEKRLLDWGK